MKVFNIGELIRQRRIECGFSQEELCYGICEQPTMSRIENGTTTPSRSKLTALLQRLGMVGEKYYALLSENELAVANLQSEIMTCMVQRDSIAGLDKVEQLEQIMEKDDHILKQFILRSRVAFGKRTDAGIEKYKFEERIDLLYEAIRLTVPQFEIEKVSTYVLGTDEIQIINQIATTYTYENMQIDAIKIYSKLFNYIENHIKVLHQNSNSIPVSILITYNYARSLALAQMYNESNIIASRCHHYSIQLRNSSYLGDILYIKAYNFYYLQQLSKSKCFFRQSYYVYQAMKDIENMHLVEESFIEVFGTRIED